MEKDKKVKRWIGHIEHWQIIAVFLMAYDYVAICASYFLALFLRFDGVYSKIDPKYLDPYYQFIFPFAAGSIIIFILFRMYSGMWRYASFSELVRTSLGSITSSVLHAILITRFIQRMPLSYYILGAVFQGFFLIAIRFSYRFVQILKKRHEPVEGKPDDYPGHVPGAGGQG